MCILVCSCVGVCVCSCVCVFLCVYVLATFSDPWVFVCVLATLAAASEEDSDNTGIHTNPPSTERMVMMMVVTVFVGA